MSGAKAVLARSPRSSFDDAVKNAVEEGARTIRGINGV